MPFKPFFFVILFKLVKVIPVSVEWEEVAELWAALMLREESFLGKSALKRKQITQMYIQNLKLLFLGNNLTYQVFQIYYQVGFVGGPYWVQIQFWPKPDAMILVDHSLLTKYSIQQDKVF